MEKKKLWGNNKKKGINNKTEELFGIQITHFYGDRQRQIRMNFFFHTDQV